MLWNSRVDEQFRRNFLASVKSKIGLRRYSRKFDNVSTAYYLDFRSQNLGAGFELEDRVNYYNWLRRRVSYHTNRVDLRLGNYIITEGAGLAIGRFDKQPNAGYDDGGGADFIFPDNSYYNGLSLTYGKPFSGRFYYSRKNYDRADKDFAGFCTGYDIERLAFSLLTGWNRLAINDTVDTRLAAGLNARYTGSQYTIFGEYANLQKANAIYLRFDKTFERFKYFAEFWSYSKSFENYNCSGPAAADYETFYPENQAIGFRSTQAGETGLTLNFLRKDFTAGMMCWSNRDDNRLNFDFDFSSYNLLTSQTHLLVQMAVRDRSSGRYLWSRVGLDNDYIMKKRLGAKLRITDNNRVVHNDSYAYINLLDELTERFTMLIAVRAYFNSDYYWHIGERYNSAIGISLAAEASYHEGIFINLKIEKSL